MIDLHFVIPELAVGASFPMEAVVDLATEHGIERVVDLRVEDCDDEAVLLVHGIRLLHLPTWDCRALSQSQLRDGVAFSQEGIERGQRVFIHCQYGIGRSALLAVCVLVARGDPPLEAMERLKESRPVISPAPEQLSALAEFCRGHARRTGAIWPIPTVEQLGEIAWRHLRLDGDVVDTDRARRSATRRR